MPSISSRLSRHFTMAAMLSVVFSAACGDDNPTGPGDHDHSEPAGLLAELDGETIVSVNAGRQVTGSFTVPSGEETGHVHIHFLDEDGDELEMESGYWLKLTPANGALVEFEQHEAGEFGFHVVGLAQGSTSVVVDLIHGTYPNGHSDYKSPAIPVTVTPAD